MSRRNSSSKVVVAVLVMLCPALSLGQRLPLPTAPAVQLAVAPTCTVAVSPVVQALSMSVPAPGKFLGRGNIKYVSGGQLDVALTIPQCTYVSLVRYAGLAISTSADPIEGQSTYYTVLSDRSVSITGPGSHHVVTLRLHFTNLGRGYSPLVQLTVASRIGTLTSVQAFTLAQVVDVKGIVDVAITEAELRNDFVTGLYQTFGDYNEQWTETASGDWVRVAYNASFGDGLEFRVEEDGFHVAMSFKADLGSFNSNVESWCDPTVRLGGHFTLQKDPAGVYVVWVDGPHADFDFPIYCDAVLFTVGLVVQAGIWYIMEPSAANKFGEMIEERIAGAFPADESRFAIQSIGTVDGAVVAIIGPTWGSVTIDVPYDPATLGNPVTSGLAVPAGDRVALIGGGLVDVCRTGGATEFPDCTTHTSGRAGLFNWSKNPPVPSPYVLVDGQWAYFEPRDLARARLSGFTRDPSLLPAADLNVGVLLARIGDASSTSSLRVAGSPCALVTDADPAEQQHLLLGVNDHASGSNRSYGAGSYLVSVGMAGTGAETDMIAQVGDCPTYVPPRRTTAPAELTTVAR